MENQMIGSFTPDEARDHFSHCVQVFGGIPATSRRLGIDERAIRRFLNGERPMGDELLADTAKALRLLIAEASAAEGRLASRGASERLRTMSDKSQDEHIAAAG